VETQNSIALLFSGRVKMMPQPNGAGNKSNREKAEKLIETMPATWTTFQELVKTAKLGANELRRFLIEGKKKNLLENKQVRTRFNGRICYWRRKP
jgi:hypothetical protein